MKNLRKCLLGAFILESIFLIISLIKTFYFQTGGTDGFAPVVGIVFIFMSVISSLVLFLQIDNHPKSDNVVTFVFSIIGLIPVLFTIVGIFNYINR